MVQGSFFFFNAADVALEETLSSTKATHCHTRHVRAFRGVKVALFYMNNNNCWCFNIRKPLYGCQTHHRGGLWKLQAPKVL